MAAVQEEDLGDLPFCNLLPHTLQRSPSLISLHDHFGVTAAEGADASLAPSCNHMRSALMQTHQQPSES